MAITNEMTFFVVFSDCCQFVGKLVFMSLCKLILYVIASLKSFHSNVLCLVTQSCPTLCDPMYCSPPGSSVHGDSPGKNTGVGCHALLQGDLPNPGIEPRSPALQQILYCLSHHGSPRILTGVGSLSLLQGIFPTPELNSGVLHCRWFLYQLSYQGSPIILIVCQFIICILLGSLRYYLQIMMVLSLYNLCLYFLKFLILKIYLL